MARLRCACLDLQAFVSRLPTIGSVENAARLPTLRLNPGYSPHEGECGGFGFCGRFYGTAQQVTGTFGRYVDWFFIKAKAIRASFLASLTKAWVVFSPWLR